ncbi:AAA family ATPase [uncultured Robinsoniella sp.]|uniref:AAA family ATPase n=1 Tax=Robinsoniella sp. TaxID=2496533 RepID=UPI00374E2D9D
MELKKLPVGIDDFKKMILQEYYYVDKTLLIKELIDLKGEVNLFTRPRRFGKTLNMSMLQYFFEISEENNKEIFSDLT